MSSSDIQKKFPEDGTSYKDDNPSDRRLNAPQLIQVVEVGQLSHLPTDRTSNGDFDMIAARKNGDRG